MFVIVFLLDFLISTAVTFSSCFFVTNKRRTLSLRFSLFLFPYHFLVIYFLLYYWILLIQQCSEYLRYFFYYSIFVFAWVGIILKVFSNSQLTVDNHSLGFKIWSIESERDLLVNAITRVKGCDSSASEIQGNYSFQQIASAWQNNTSDNTINSSRREPIIDFLWFACFFEDTLMSH